ncbi:MAG TPA: hypothetical protein VLA54_04370 [Acidimicrobiia bacterium]|jgi:hypothetical protein|nr:hypothetical protein [Acidimicrobiia bacterium]
MTSPRNPSKDDGSGDDRSLEHRRHDPDFIAAQAGAEHPEPVAAALIASCDGCRAEYELQRQVREWLAGTEPVQLGDDERALLHERVAAVVSGRARLSGRRIRRPGLVWVQVGVAVAGLAAVVGLAGLLPRGGGPQAATTTVLAAERGGEESLASTTAAAGETMLAAADSAARTLLPGGDAQAVKAEIAALIARGPDPAGYSSDETDGPACIAELDAIEPISVAESTLDDTPIIIFILPGEGDPEALVFEVGTCDRVDLG